ncbi:MAG TPA: HIT family protein [Caldisericia bacterium]|nr:HIT family protein [Caldisericia bacterium]
MEQVIYDLNCKFCNIAAKEVESYIVFEDEVSLAFLDIRPLFPGHTLLIPKIHYETLSDLPVDLIAPLFKNVKLLDVAVKQALKTDGTFIAINNKVSQSIPHLHVHIVPRRKGDGLTGFFWPRNSYKDKEEILKTQQIIKEALKSVRL